MAQRHVATLCVTVKTGLQRSARLHVSRITTDRNRQKAKGVTKIMSSGKKQSRKENTGTARKLRAVMHNKANMVGHESELSQSSAITLCSKQLHRLPLLLSIY